MHGCHRQVMVERRPLANKNLRVKKGDAVASSQIHSAKALEFLINKILLKICPMGVVSITDIYQTGLFRVTGVGFVDCGPDH